jgi:hypothetical protein
MSANAPSNNAPRLLKELKIPGRTGPVTQTPLTWGINLAALKLNFPRQGLLCQAGPWGTMDIGDSLRIWRGSDQLIGLEIVDKNEVNTELQIFVQAKHFPDGMHNISYAVTRLGGTPEHSEVMQVLVKTTLPGGPDHSETPGHPALVMSIPKEILEGGINMENVKNGIPVTLGKGDGTPPYPFASAGDKLQFICGGIFYEAPELTEEQANGTTPLVATIPEETIRKAGDSDATGMAIAFEVYDPVHNRSEDWSREQRVVVTLDTTLLVAPLLKEAINNELDVDKLAGAVGTAQVWVSGNSFKVGDRPVLRIRGTPREGQPIDLEVRGEVLVSVPSTHETNIPNAVLRQLVQTQIALSYRLEKADGSTELKSKTQFISAIGEIHRLAAPVALDAEQGAIDPLDPDLKQVRIEIPFDASFLPGQAIKQLWLGTRPDLSTYLPTLPLRLISQGDYEAKDPLLIIVDIQHLTAIIGGKLELYYQLLIEDPVLGTMTQLNQTHAIRESIHADILQIGEPRKELPEPQVNGVVDGMLPPDTNGTTLTVNYLKTSVGDIVTRFWRGSNTGVNSDWVKLSSFTAGQPVPFPIKAELIKDNEGGTAEADYQIEWAAGGTSYSDTLKFNVGVKPDLKVPEIKEAVNNVLQPIAAKYTLTAIVRAFPNMVGTQVSVTWAGTPGEGSTTVGPITVTAQQDLEVSLDNLLVALNLGNKDVKVSYIVTLNGTPQGSKESTLHVAAIVDGDNNLPTPSIDGAVGNELDVTLLKDSAQLRIDKWLLQALSQCIWLRYDGTDKNGKPVECVFWAGEAHQQAEGLVTAALVAWLRELDDGTTLTITFKVNYDKVANANTAVGFPVRTYTVKAALPLEIDTNLMVLDGNNWYPASAPHTPPYEQTAYLHPQAHQTREAQGGSPPYHYNSSNPTAASVDPLTGRVVSTGVGTARITVRDATGANVSYEVTSKNVYELVHINERLTHPQFVTRLASLTIQQFTGRPDPLPTDQFLRTLFFSFQKTGALPQHVWTTTIYGPNEVNQDVWNASGTPAQWQQEPYTGGLAFAGRDISRESLNPGLGYRLLRARLA